MPSDPGSFNPDLLVARDRFGLSRKMAGRDLSGSLMVMITYACQLRCAYCAVLRGGRTMGWETLRSAIDLLFTAERDRLQLRYFGGEPLIRFDLIRRAIRYAESRQAAAGKRVRHMITTNGILLDEEKLSWLSGRDVEIMFSLDGSAETHRLWRPALGGRNVHGRLLANLRALRRSRIPHFVNVVVVPGGLERARKDLSLLASWGVGRVQIGYRVGAAWSEGEKDDFLRFMAETVRREFQAPRMEILNLNSECEPVMLSDELIVDTDGGIYLDAAVFMERRFPDLRGALRVGSLGEAAGLSELQRTRTQVLRLCRRCYPPRTPLGRLFLNNLALGLETGRLMAGLQREAACR